MPSATDGFLTLQVEDDGPGFGSAATSSCGIGLANTATRLEELYGNRSRMSVGKSTMGGVDIKIRIPLFVCKNFVLPDFTTKESEWASEHY
jgi:signal transduction histidine kinase